MSEKAQNPQGRGAGIRLYRHHQDIRGLKRAYKPKQLMFLREGLSRDGGARSLVYRVYPHFWQTATVFVLTFCLRLGAIIRQISIGSVNTIQRTGCSHQPISSQ